MKGILNGIVVLLFSMVLVGCGEESIESSSHFESLDSAVAAWDDHYRSLSSLNSQSDAEEILVTYPQWYQIGLALERYGYQWTSGDTRVQKHFELIEKYLNSYETYFGVDGQYESLRSYFDSEEQRLHSKLNTNRSSIARTEDSLPFFAAPRSVTSCPDDGSRPCPGDGGGDSCEDDPNQSKCEDRCDTACKAGELADEMGKKFEDLDEDLQDEILDAIETAEANGQDISESLEKQLKDKIRNSERGKTCCATSDDPVELPTGAKVTRADDGQLPLLGLARTHRISQLSAWSLGAGWHSAIDTRIILGVESPDLDNDIALQRASTEGLQSALDSVDYWINFFQTEYSNRTGFSHSKAQNKLTQILNALYAERDKIVHDPALADDPLEIAKASLQALEELKALSDDRENQNQHAVDPNTPSEAIMGVTTIKWIAPSGSRVRFNDPESGAITPVGGHTNRLTRTDSGYRVESPDSRIYGFNEYGLLTRVEDSQGRYLVVHRDGDQQATALEDQFGRRWNLEYNSNGRLTHITDPAQRTLEYQYDGQSRLIRVIGFDGSTQEYDYNYSSNPLVITDKRDGEGNEASYQFEQQAGRTVIKRQYDEEDYYWSYQYDFDNNSTVLVQRNGLAVTNHYNDNYKFTRKDFGAFGVQRFEYDADGNLTDEWNQLDEHTGYTHNELGQVLTTTDGTGRTTTYTRDDRGRVLTKTDNAGNTTHYVRDEYGQIDRIEYPDGHYVDETWENGLIRQRIDQDGNITEWQYDSNGYPERIDYFGPVRGDEDDAFRRMEHDAIGRVQRVIEGSDSLPEDQWRTTRYYYVDEETGRDLNKPTRIVDPNGREAVYRYDGNNQIVFERDFSGVETVYTYKPRGQVDTKVITMPDPNQQNGSIQYKYRYFYDAEGNLEIAEHPGDVTWKYTYDDRNRLKRSEILGTEVVQTFDYDLVGRKLSEDDNAGGTVSYTYYDDGQIETLTTPLGNLLTHHYDLRGDLDFVEDVERGVVTRDVQRDALGRVTAETGPRGNTVDFGLNGRGLVRSRSAPNDPTMWRIEREYDWRGQPTEVTDIEGGRTVRSYNAFGELSRLEDSEGGIVDHEYDALGREIRTVDAAGLITTWDYDQQPNRLVVTKTQTDPSLSVVRSDRTRVSVEVYDLMGRLVASEDAEGQRWEYDYNQRGLLARVDNPDGSYLINLYNDAGHLETETFHATDGTTRTTSYQRDPKGRILNREAPHGATTGYHYNGNGQITDVYLPDGISTIHHEYDAAGRKTHTYYPEGLVESWQYNAADKIKRHTDRNGDTWAYFYNADNQLEYEHNPVSVNRGLTEPTQYHYDNLGRRVGVTDPKGNYQSQRLDTLGRVDANVDAYGRELTYERDPAGRIQSQTDRLGYTTSFDYNAFGEREAVTNPLGQTTQTWYDALGRRVEQENALGKRTTWDYNYRNQVTQVTDALNRITEYRYNDYGEQTDVIQPSGATTHYDWDDGGRLRFVTNAKGNTTEYRYSQRDELVTTIDPLGYVTAYIYDDLGRVTLIDQPEAGTDINLDYNGRDQLTERRFQGVVEQWDYDPAGRLERIESPNSVESYVYDPAGNLDRVTNHTLGLTIDYAYDNNNRRTFMSDPNGGTGTVYERDYEGRIVNQTYNDETTSFKRDALGRITERVLPNSSRDLTLCDEVGCTRAIVQQVPDSTQYGFDDRFFNSFKAPTHSDWYDHQSDWQATRNELENQFTANGWKTEDQHLYFHDDVGNLSARLYNEKFSFFYDYDENDRLVRADEPENLITTYRWDAVGNLDRKQVRDLVYQYDYNANDQLTSADHWRLRHSNSGNSRGNGGKPYNHKGILSNWDSHHLDQQHLFEYRWDTSVNHTQERLTQSYDYDANGYPTQVDLGNGAVETSQHDALGRLTQQVSEYGAQYDFAYDARDRRVHTELSNWERSYAFHSLYNGRQELGQWDEQLNPYRSLNTLPQEAQGLPYGTLISQEVHQWQNEEFRVSGFAKNYADKAYFHQDHLGSTVKISSENPTNAFRWDYTPMGEAYGFKHRYSHEQMTRTHVGHSPKRNLVPYLYQGKYETNLSGLVQMDARWYKPGLGRWLQPDYYNFAQLSLPKGARQQLLATTSLNTQGLLRDPAQQMRYGYVSGNPLRWVDPFGLCYPEAHGVEPVRLQPSAEGGWEKVYQDRTGALYSESIYQPEPDLVTPAETVDQMRDNLVEIGSQASQEEGAWAAVRYYGSAAAYTALEFAPTSASDVAITMAGGPVAKAGKKGIRNVWDALSDTSNKVDPRLQKQLASEEQLGQLTSGGGTVISQPAKQADRIAAQTGRNPEDIQKVSSDARVANDGQQIQTHSFRDASTYELIEPKTIIDD